jgi:hypothetical protein
MGFHHQNLSSSKRDLCPAENKTLWFTLQKSALTFNVYSSSLMCARHVGGIAGFFWTPVSARVTVGGTLLAPAKSRQQRTVVSFVLAALVLAGCASVSPGVAPVSAPMKEVAKPSRNGWWYARFAVNWPPNREPTWYVDPLLAHRVLSPVLDQYGNDIVLWRFHRRAMRDQAGHQFSFIFYATQDTARGVFATIEADGTLKAMRNGGVIIRFSCDDLGTITRPNLEDTSDRAWSLPIQKSWPFYIMGASEMWLSLIREIATGTSSGKPPANLAETLAFYEEINAAIEKMWQEEGQHAFLHHLNAIFGYEPLVVRHKFLLGF